MKGPDLNQVLYLGDSLEVVLALPDEEAAEQLNERVKAWDVVDDLHDRSYAERGFIAVQVEKRKLWQWMTNPNTGEPFISLSAWMNINGRSTNYDAKRDIEPLVRDIPASDLIEIPKHNLPILNQLSTAVRRDPQVIAAAKTMQIDDFRGMIDRDHPNQHIQSKITLRFHPERSDAETVEQAIQWALTHNIAKSRDEALGKMAYTALKDWELDEELRAMPITDTPAPERIQ